ncbi:MAG: FliM/FliN family flagellar motor switch protein [Planctomycetes bacterium]|nr:FliM/FliN family flagellar motor switch protein [Planctomycetota bacterium]
MSSEMGNRTEGETLDDILDGYRGQGPQENLLASRLPSFGRDSGPGTAAVVESASPETLRSEVLKNVRLKVKVELGRTRMPLGRTLKLGPGSVVDLGKEMGGLVDISVHSIPIARGQLMVVDGRFCVRVLEILTRPEEESP